MSESESAAVPVRPEKSFIKILVLAMSIVLLLLVYGAGFIGLPIAVLANVQNRNCDSVLSLNKIYMGLYPKFIQDKTLQAPVKECEAYLAAVSNEENGTWGVAYDAYQAYLKTYPNGMYAKEAHEHSGIVLLRMGKDQVEQKKYDEAVKNLNLITTTYYDTSASAETWTLLPSIYTSWGTELREAGDFEQSEQVLNDFKSWAETYQQNESAKNAKSELAQTYVAWGRDCQSEKEFEDALAKFEMAISSDPEPQVDSSSTAQAKSGERKVYIAWGNDLLQQKQFSAAMEKFERAVALADGDHDDGAGEALANGHIQWAASLRASEDFEGALKQLDSGKQAAQTDDVKKSVDTALSETYLAFSKSTGPQAQRAMKDALKTVCQQHKEPALPIFGLNKDSVRVGIYGVDAKLPENLLARTPGEMHYVACVEVLNHTVESRYHKVIIDRTAWGYYYRLVQQFRAQVLWDITLRNIDTTKSVAETTLTGGTPPPFSESGDAGGYFYGLPPTVEQLSEWLESVLK